MKSLIVCLLAVLAGFAALFGSPAPASAALLNLSAAPVTVSSIYGIGYEGPLAFNNNLADRWSSTAADPNYIYVDLGQSYSLNKVKLFWEVAAGKTYGIYTRTDAPSPTFNLGEWTQVATVSSGVNGQSGSHNSTPDVTFDWTASPNPTVTFSSVGPSGTISPAAPAARYVMMYGTMRTTTYGYSIFEFQVDATAVPEPATLAFLGLGGLVIGAGMVRRRRTQ